MANEVFEGQSLDNMLELDPELNINMMLNDIPALEKDSKEDKKDPEEKSEISLKNIDKVLEDQSKQLEEDKKKVDDKKTKDDEAPAPIDTSTDDTSDAPFTVIFARDLVAQGLLSSFDEEKFNKDIQELGEAEALRNLIKSEVDVNISAAKSDLDEGYKQYLEMIGKGVPVESAGDLMSLKTRFDNIKVEDLDKEDNVELRKQILTDYYKLTSSMPDAKIEKLVQSSVDLGDDVEDSKEYLTTLKTLIKEQIGEEEKAAEKQKALVAEENRRNLDALKDSINSLSEIIPGVSINKQTKQQMFDSITKPIQDNKGRTTNAIWAKRAEDPAFFDQRLAYLLVTDFFNKDKPWTKASMAKVTKEISELEKTLDSKRNTGSRSGTTVLRSPEQDKSTKDNIDALRGLLA